VEVGGLSDWASFSFSSISDLLLLFLLKLLGIRGKRKVSKGCKTGFKQDFKNLIYCLKIIFKGLQIFLV
jgi:hypothetical protein